MKKRNGEKLKSNTKIEVKPKINELKKSNNSGFSNKILTSKFEKDLET